MKIEMKTPISYYGGKQSMLKKILPLIPEHRVYLEPFFGGGAVFWAKKSASVEVINDANGMVVNFYEQLKTNYDNLKKAIDATPYSRAVYKRAMVVYENPYIFEPLVKAWAFWVCTIQGFSNKIGSWKNSSPSNKEIATIQTKKASLTEAFCTRLDLVQIENMNAVELISRFDSKDVFIYADPPYVNSNQGHYGGYTQSHFDELLTVLSLTQSKFLLSCYPNERVDVIAKQHNWRIENVDMHLSVSLTGKRKTEVLVSNF